VRSWRLITVLLLCLALADSTACMPLGGDGEEEEAKQQLIEVVMRDLIISVSGSGSIGVSREARLTFGSSGKVDGIFVNTSNRVSEGEVLAKLDTASLELALAQAQAALTQAQVSLEMAKFNMDRTIEDVAEAEEAVSDAEHDMEFAEAKLEEAFQAGDNLAIRHWRIEVLSAQARLTIAQQELAKLLADPDYSGLIIEEVIIKKLQVEAAEKSLEATERSLEQAQKQLDQATITAPFDGVVASVFVDEGDTASAATAIVHLIDLSSLEVQVGVDEIDIPSVKLNQRAIISVDALFGPLLEGWVSSISPMPAIQTGLVLYDVTISFDVPEDSVLRVGMSATADIIINERSSVLLVPNQAIKQDSQGNPAVKVMVGEQILVKPVVIGLTDGFQTEIVSGLDEGEIVVIEIQTRTAEPSHPSGGFFRG